MRVITLAFSVLFLSLALVQTQAPNQCTTVCTVTDQPNANNDGSYVIHMSEDVIYFYMIQYNVFVVVNIRLRIVVFMDGTNGTLITINPDTGFGDICNVHTDLVFTFTENLQTFDIDVIRSGDYSSVVLMIEYVIQYNIKVVGKTIKTIDSNEAGYSESHVILLDYATTTDYTKWVSYQDQTEVINQLMESNSQVTKILFELFESKKYTVEWGPVMYLVVATGVYEMEDKLLIEFNNFAVSIVRTLECQFNKYLMKIYYEILVSQQTQEIDITIEQYRNLTWVINGVPITYETLDIALAAYEDRNVVQTYLSTITVNETTSYVAYNSIRNGTSNFRITYGINHYVQVTSSYYDGYMGIYDPSVPYTMVFTKTNQFAMINHKTGKGFIIDGFTLSATYIVEGNQDIIDAFGAGRYIDGFKYVQAITESTKIEENDSFNATLFFIALQKGESYQEMLNEDQLASFETDFATLGQQLTKVDFENNEFGISNLVVVMLAGTDSKFFQDGLVALLSRMFYFEIAGGRFYRITYGGIVENINKKFSEQMFMNTYKVMLLVQKENGKEAILEFMENFIRVTTNPVIDVTREEFTRDGTLGNKK